MTDEGPDIFDVEPPVEIPIASPWWVMPLVVGLILLIAGAIWWWFKWRKHEAAGVRPKERALQRLAMLQSQVSKIDGYQFGVQVSDVLRSYITEAHQLKASQQTSREFLTDLEERSVFSERSKAFIKSFLESCDFLKYAPAGKAEEPNHELLEQTTLFIRQDIG